MRRALLGRAAVALACGAWWGCASGHNLDEPLGSPPTVGERPVSARDGSSEDTYRDVLRRYSQRAEVYASVVEGIDTRMYCAATYQALPLREARVRRKGAFELQTQAEIDGALAIERQEAAQYDDFFFGAHLVDYHYDDFDRPKSVWRIALVGDGVEERPLSVERVGRATADMRAYYPYMDDFWVGYRIRFAKLANGRSDRFTLRIASTAGQVDMRFPSE